MTNKNILVTGSSGLIGSEVVKFFYENGYHVYGIDNNMRQVFFGEKGSTRKNLVRLKEEFPNFINYEVDIRDRKKIEEIISSLKPLCVIHTAAQPSHDKAASIPFLDFEVNALGTLNLLEALRRFSKDTSFVHLSTNKVYGDNPNKVKMIELETRWEFKGNFFKNGINEKMSIDNAAHSLFGVSKVSADLMVQEYGRLYKIPTCCLRGGCLTGPSHSGVELHGFLNYLIRCNISREKYTIFGYKGKQVRDNIHSLDVAKFIFEFVKSPKIASVYNIGGGYENSISMLEAIDRVESITNFKMNYEYDEKSRFGDHICYYSDLNQIKKDFPNWNITKNLEYIIEDVFITLKNNL
ncbi:MAG: NAD-dependent epimerase/dehydratase family protein [Pelagibacteraceae bacterium TMED124]|nr:MAG: NAD-dependent epimerase/dehydratase family protein [Pelagibacteraceae bacterium TMED124]|tara:strand:+ start:465 stop:1520 length:1056 start_codon:yes stop_codon:yes gene_type:complete